MSNNNMVTVYSSEAQNALLDNKTVPQADGLGVPAFATFNARWDEATEGNSGLCCCVCLTSFLYVDFALQLKQCIKIK